MASNTIRTILRDYRCYQIVHSINCGSEIVFLPFNRLIFFLCSNWCSNCFFHSWRDSLKQLKSSKTTPGKGTDHKSSERAWFLCHTYPTVFDWVDSSFLSKLIKIYVDTSFCLVHGTYGFNQVVVELFSTNSWSYWKPPKILRTPGNVQKNYKKHIPLHSEAIFASSFI